MKNICLKYTVHVCLNAHQGCGARNLVNISLNNEVIVEGENKHTSNDVYFKRLVKIFFPALASVMSDIHNSVNL